MWTGVAWYLGIPQIGKTELMLKHLSEDVASTGYPSLLVDSMHAKNFRSIYHPSSVDEVVSLVWREGKHTVYWPRNRDELDQLMNAVLGGMRCHLGVDEAHIWMSGRYLPDSISGVMRGHAHWDGTVRLTTQFYGDVSLEAKSVSPRRYIFACEDDTTVERLVNECRFTEDQIRNLPDYEFLFYDPAEARARRLAARPPVQPAPGPLPGADSA